MEKWIDLQYSGLDFSDQYEYNASGEIRNKKSHRIMKQTGNSVVINYQGVYQRINIPFLLTGKYAEPKKHKRKAKDQFSPEHVALMRTLIREEIGRYFERLSRNN